MTKRFYLIVLIAVLLWLPVVGAEKPKMVPPNATAYSASELATLQAAVSSLQDLLFLFLRMDELGFRLVHSGNPVFKRVSGATCHAGRVGRRRTRLVIGWGSYFYS